MDTVDPWLGCDSDKMPESARELRWGVEGDWGGTRLPCPSLLKATSIGSHAILCVPPASSLDINYTPAI